MFDYFLVILTLEASGANSFFIPKDLQMESVPRHFSFIVIMVLDFCQTSKALITDMCILPDTSSVNMATNNPNQTST